MHPNCGDIDELRRIIEEKTKELSREIVRVKEVGTTSPHGIYIYDAKNDEWVLVQRDGDYFKPFMNGFYVIYFDNTKCPACRKYDKDWFPYIREEGRKLPGYCFVIILCEWFAGMCKSEAASKSFKHYDIHASPTTLLIYHKDGKIIYQEKHEGYLTRNELRTIVGDFCNRALKAERGEKVEPPRRRIENELIVLLKKLLEMGGKP